MFSKVTDIHTFTCYSFSCGVDSFDMIWMRILFLKLSKKGNTIKLWDQVSNVGRGQELLVSTTSLFFLASGNQNNPYYNVLLEFNSKEFTNHAIPLHLY